MIYGLGLDPGSRGAVALCSHTGKRGTLPEAIGAWPVWGEWPALWYRRALEACEAAVEQWVHVPGRLPVFGTAEPIIWQEDVIGKSQGGRISTRSWQTFGKHQGALLTALHQVSGLWPVEVENTAWRAVWGLGKKEGDGKHRIREAGMYVRGSKAILEGVRESCVIDASEALLIAGAACMNEAVK